MSNKIIITSHTNKINLLKKLNTSLNNIKIYTLEEFNRLYYFDYNEQTIYYIMNKYNVIYEIAKIYLNNLYYIENKEYKNNKLSFLVSLKKELISEKLLTHNPLFNDYISNKEIVFYNIPHTKELDSLSNSLSSITKVSYEQTPINKYSHTIYSLNSDIEEVEFIANKICSIVKEGISLSHIYLTNLNSKYRKIIRRIFPMFNLPITLEVEDNIYSTSLSTKFFENYNSDLSTTLLYLNTFVTDESSSNIVNKMISIINKYSFIDDKLLVKDMIKYDFKNTKVDIAERPNSIHEVNLKETIFNDNEYVFTVGFNQGILPTIHKDENYLTDYDKQELNISYTIDKNNLEKELISNKLSSIKNLTITYPLISDNDKLSISSLNETLSYEVIPITNLPLVNSNLYNKIKLTSYLDTFYKYGTINKNTISLFNTYPDLKYKKYDNKYTGLNPLSVYEYLNNKLTLSYSSLDKYYRCPFSYYLTKILKLDIYDTTFPQVVGNIFHAILEKRNSTSLTYDELWNQELLNTNYSFSSKESFFLKKLKQELKFIIETIDNQEELTTLHNELHEEEIITNIDESKNITFKGYIDKVKYKTENDETIAAIIDYKTGHPNIDLTTLPYGIGMQLPVYLYLLKHSSKIHNVKIAGFYLQKILNNEIKVETGKTYEQLKKKNLLLQGYSNSDLSILSSFDSSYNESHMIDGMKTKKDGSISSKKILSSKEIDFLAEEVEKKIKEGANLIVDSNFTIAPKEIGNKDYGCSMCKYNDICFHTNKDIVSLPSKELKEILGSDNNELDN